MQILDSNYIKVQFWQKLYDFDENDHWILKNTDLLKKIIFFRKSHFLRKMKNTAKGNKINKVNIHKARNMASLTHKYKMFTICW